MDINLCVKYLDFLDIQINRFLEDGIVDDDELESMNIELIKFKTLVKKSNLPSEIKINLQSLSFEYSPIKLKLSFFVIILLIITIGCWTYIYDRFQQKKRENNLLHFKDQVRAISNDLKLNYNYSI